MLLAGAGATLCLWPLIYEGWKIFSLHPRMQQRQPNVSKADNREKKVICQIINAMFFQRKYNFISVVILSNLFYLSSAKPKSMDWNFRYDRSPCHFKQLIYF